MKNIQVIDGADNCTYDIFQVDDEGFDEIFPNGQDIEFIEDLRERIGEKRSGEILSPAWSRRVVKKDVVGIHGILFYKLIGKKKKYYPTKKDEEMTSAPGLPRQKQGTI